ncbi:MAG: aminoglycoside phosphotransferase family protein [Rhodospirillaceae bacterium]|jgi:aminoglycoside phosphotransferase (APT) family kinase protein|nr:aminoglycoside phosphotransferase family protein [Rhodospirillaceae bacterium]MBT6136052.1 aminoglycoside phosphotransferase family protein [Rhodospirillaceae bacterium]
MNDIENSSNPGQELTDALRHMNVLDPIDSPTFTALTGGVSSDIWKVETSDRTFCVKRALAKLKVAADWQAPIERNRYEVAWFRTAGAIVPTAVPEILGDDAEAGFFAMAWLDPGLYRLWKTELRDGNAQTADATAVGDALGRIHAGTAGRKSIESAFQTDEIFHAIRLEPYLEATGRAHPDLVEIFADLVRQTAETRLVLVHGDVSPKNILLGPEGPVFLDAECAWYGDPAFDLAFCLNHFLLKCLWTPEVTPEFLDSFRAMTSAYLAKVDWEDKAGLERRAAHLLPGLFLARVDGKSPVEYITSETDRNQVRRIARALLKDPVETLEDVVQAWERELLG